MADVKITALTALTAADPANDVIPIVDVSDTTMAASGTTKKISVNNILGASGTATLASATITGALDAARLNVTGATIPANGVYLGSANNLSFSANSTLGMILNSTGLLVGGATAQIIAAENTTLTTIGNMGAAYASATGTYFAVKVGAPGGIVELKADARSGAYPPIVFTTSATQRMQIDAAGNVGVGVTPSAWNSTVPALQVKGVSGIYGAGSAEFGSVQNCFYNASSQWIYGTAAAAGKYAISSGVHQWYTAASGTINTEITAFATARMTLDLTGNLLVGTTSTAGSSSNATALVLGGARTANGSVSATTAVATTIFSITAALTGRYEVVALIGFSGAPAQYTAIATIIWDGNGSRVVANNGSNLTITISGSNVQITQTSGSTQTVSWSFLRIAL